MSRTAKVAAVVVMTVAAGALSFGVVRARTLATRAARASTTTATALATKAASPFGTYLRVYFLYSSDCAICKDPSVMRAISAMPAAVRAAAVQRGYQRVSMMAASPDGARTKSLQYLDRLGARSFDEVNIGGGWLNATIGDLVWRTGKVQASVPQVLVYRRHVSGTMEPYSMTVSPDTLLGIVSGRTEILKWEASGFSLDSLRAVR
jgi:hypothetical protein